MFKKFIPFCHADSIYKVDPDFFKKQGVKTLFIDLDNTLDSYKAVHAKEETIAYIKSLADLGIEPVIISNNRAKRVDSFAKDCGITYIASARKPFARKLLREISKRNLSCSDVMLVGDQMMTDVLAASGAHIRVMLTEKLVKEDQWTTRINRLVDRPIRKYHKKHKNLKDWREI